MNHPAIEELDPPDQAVAAADAISLRAAKYSKLRNRIRMLINGHHMNHSVLDNNSLLQKQLDEVEAMDGGNGIC